MSVFRIQVNAEVGEGSHWIDVSTGQMAHIDRTFYGSGDNSNDIANSLYQACLNNTLGTFSVKNLSGNSFDLYGGVFVTSSSDIIVADITPSKDGAQNLKTAVGSFTTNADPIAASTATSALLLYYGLEEVFTKLQKIDDLLSVSTASISHLSELASTTGITLRMRKGNLTPAQQRALTVSSLKRANQIDDMEDEINNPTPLPGDEI